MMRWLASVLVLLFAALAAAKSAVGERLLVVMDDVEQKSAYGTFLGDIEARGLKLSFGTPKTGDLALFKYGERVYDHVLFLPSKVKGLGPNLTPNILIDFINANGNIMVALSSEVATPTSIIGLLAELDIHLPAERTGTVVDHFNYDTINGGEKHDVLVLEAQPNVRPGMKTYLESPGTILSVPHAVGHVLGGSQLLTPVLRAPATAYSYDPKEQSDAVDPDDLFAAGQQLALASTMQARNGARVSVLGSAEMLTDKYYNVQAKKPEGKKVKPNNRAFARRLSGWTFQESGVLRVNDITHNLKGSNETNPGIYRIKNEVTYKISISEWDFDKWVPFTVPEGDDLQLEFSMLSPFHRLNLPAVATTESPPATVFSTDFVLPDQHGIFNFKINYKRPFTTYLEEKNTVSVRHMAHDEWPRSFVISGAWPWLGGIAATVVGFVGFCAVWMYSAPTDKRGVKKTQ